MNKKQYNEACKQANSTLNPYEVQEALETINNREPIPSKIATKLYDAMEEYCQDNDFAEGEWLEWGDEEDVFFNNDGEE